MKQIIPAVTLSEGQPASVTTDEKQPSKAGERNETARPAVRRWTLLTIQFGFYCLVGGTAFLADLAISIELLAVGTPLLIAFSFGYIIGFLVNYVLSIWLAFRGGRFSQGAELARLILVNLVGIALTLLLVRIFITIPAVSPILAKILATPIVLFWNFLGRRFFVFYEDMPAMTAALSNAIANSFGSGAAQIDHVPQPSPDALKTHSGEIQVFSKHAGEEP